MGKRELIKAEIEKLGEEDLQEVYDLIVQLKKSKEKSRKSLMAALREIKINAPPDFATNLDLYLSGERVLPEPESQIE